MERLAYTPHEACAALRIGRTKLYELLGSGHIKAVALGGKTLIPREALDAFMASLPSIPMQRLHQGDTPQNKAEKGGKS